MVTYRYTYNIRHLYGLEGSRIDRAPYSCKVIIRDYSARVSLSLSRTSELLLKVVVVVVLRALAEGGRPTLQSPDLPRITRSNDGSARSARPGMTRQSPGCSEAAAGSERMRWR